MGLDVYLEKCDDLEKRAQIEVEMNAIEEKIWASYGSYASLTTEQKQEARAKIEQLHIDYGYVGGEYPHESIEIDSEKYPEHLFKIGYFRSSYNGGGINNVLSTLGLPSIYEIMGNDNDDYMAKPNWSESRTRCLQVIESLKKAPPYIVSDVSHNPYGAPDIRSKKEALDVFICELESEKSFRSYSNRNGDFRLDGVRCYGFIPGFDILNSPCVYLILEREGGYSFYIQALEIVIETIDWVAMQPDSDKYYLVWSG